MIKRSLIIVFFVFVTHVIEAQTFNTTIQGNISGFFITKGGNIPSTEQIGITLVHSINCKLAYELGFQDWFLGKNGGVLLDLTAQQSVTVGEVEFRNGYKFIDGGVRYYLLSSRHNNLYAGAGLSFVWGNEQYIYAVSSVPGYLDKQILYKSRVAYHVGGNILLGYNYKFAKERVSIGISNKFRLLTGNMRYYDVSLNLGYNFNSFKKANH